MMQELIEQLRKGDFTSDDILGAADMLEAQGKEIAELEYVRQLDVDEFNALKVLCDQMGEAISLHLTHHEHGCAYLDEALAAWRVSK